MLDFGQNLVSFTFCNVFLYFRYSTAQQCLEQSYCLFFSSHLFFLSFNTSEALVSGCCSALSQSHLTFSPWHSLWRDRLRATVKSSTSVLSLAVLDSSDKHLETRGVRWIQTVIMTLRFSAAGNEMSRYLTLSQAQLLIRQTVSHLDSKVSSAENDTYSPKFFL